MAVDLLNGPMQLFDLFLQGPDGLAQFGVAGAGLTATSAVVPAELLFNPGGFALKPFGFIAFADRTEEFGRLPEVDHPAFGIFGGEGAFRVLVGFAAMGGTLATFVHFAFVPGVLFAAAVLAQLPNVLGQVLGLLVATGTFGDGDFLFEFGEMGTELPVVVSFVPAIPVAGVVTAFVHIPSVSAFGTGRRARFPIPFPLTGGFGGRPTFLELIEKSQFACFRAFAFLRREPERF